MSVISYHMTMLAQGRKNLVGILSQYSTEQLNLVPSGFNNNLIWNFAHIIVSHQILCYVNSGLDPVIPAAYIDQFRRGTTPQTLIDGEQVIELKTLAIETVVKFKEDYHQGNFKEYKSYQSLYGVKISSIEDAMVFNNTHEGLHLGYIMTMKKLV